MDWETLKATCLQCTMCPLCQTRHNVVFGVGPTDAEILFVGEGPGEQEDLTGEPFVGPAGKLLDDMLRIIDLGRHNCYIANIVKCRPPHNRDPLGTEQDACIGYLRRQAKLLGAEGRHLVHRDVPPVGAAPRCDETPRYLPRPQAPAGQGRRNLHTYAINRETLSRSGSERGFSNFCRGGRLCPPGKPQIRNAIICGEFVVPKGGQSRPPLQLLGKLPWRS